MKKPMAITLVMILTLSLAACGGNSCGSMDDIILLTVFYYYKGELLQLMVSDDGAGDYHLYVPLLTLAREPELS